MRKGEFSNERRYIDRIVIAEPFRRFGLGKALYRRVFLHAKENGIPVVTAEIDTVPYNEPSLRFHKALGFREVGTQTVRNGTVQVSLQAASVDESVSICEKADLRA